MSERKEIETETEIEKSNEIKFTAISFCRVNFIDLFFSGTRIKLIGRMLVKG